MGWKTVERPGYFGKSRDQLKSLWDCEHGAGNWRVAWEWRDLVIERREALQIYEDAYYEWFRKNSGILKNLTGNYSDVYDTATSNVDSKFDYDIQETPNNHLHDIAIRRAVLRNGVWFSGNELLCVRGGGAGKELNPHFIPFHPISSSRFNLCRRNKRLFWKRRMVERTRNRE